MHLGFTEKQNTPFSSTKKWIGKILRGVEVKKKRNQKKGETAVQGGAKIKMLLNYFF